MGCGWPVGRALSSGPGFEVRLRNTAMYANGTCDNVKRKFRRGYHVLEVPIQIILLGYQSGGAGGLKL